MAVEFVLAVSMTWVSPQGQVMTSEYSGRYPTHQACVQAMAQRVEFLKVVHGVAPLPIGTELCAQHQVVPVRTSPAADGAAAAAARAIREFEAVDAKPKAKR